MGKVGGAGAGWQRLLVAAVLLLGSWGACAAESAGIVKTLTGTAFVTRDAGALALAPGDRVFPGDRISAAAGSYVGITLRDDTRLAIGPGSSLEIRDFAFDASSYAGRLAISFLRGTARVITGLLSKHAPERVDYRTPTMTIGIRGTDFIVDLGSQR
jgi:hypothetical protein